MRFRVDNIPALLQPAFQLYGHGGALLWGVGINLLRSTVTFERRTASPTSSISGRAREEFSSHVPVNQPRIECVWHENVPAYMAHYLPPPPGCPTHAWMNHPAWRMHVVHIWLRRNGVDRLVLGSSGHGGRAALDDLAEILNGGGGGGGGKDGGQQQRRRSTMFAVDGPSGPVREVKRGALDLALMTGLPLVGISFRYEGRCVRAPGWDGKYYPIPFMSEVKIREGRPIRVTEENYDDSRRRLENDLG